MRVDSRAHEFFEEYPHIPWRDFNDVGLDEPYYDYYYAESELYIIRDRITECMWFIEARSPKEALEELKDRWPKCGEDISEDDL